MSSQIAFLKGLIISAQSGSDGAIVMLRKICSEAAQKAPTADLISLGQCLVSISNRTNLLNGKW